MRIAALVGVVGTLAACAITEKPEVWLRTDGGSVATGVLSATTAECRNEAVLAVARFGKLAIPNTFAQAGPNPYIVVPPPTPGSYQAPIVDLSSIGRLPDDYAAGAERRRRSQLQDQIMRTTMDACMARSGYIRGT
jgi:hypothetical protein